MVACPKSRRETVTRCYVSVIAEIEMHGNVSEFVYKEPRTCVRTDLQLIGDLRVHRPPKLTASTGTHVPPESQRTQAATHVSHMQHVFLRSCLCYDSRTEYDRWVKLGDDPENGTALVDHGETTCGFDVHSNVFLFPMPSTKERVWRSQLLSSG